MASADEASMLLKVILHFFVRGLAIATNPLIFSLVGLLLRFRHWMLTDWCTFNS
jgi:hypothetical protein